jgi:hypothetical protein
MEDFEVILTLLGDVGTIGILIYIYREERNRGHQNVAYYRRLVKSLIAGILLAVDTSSDGEHIRNAAINYSVDEEDMQ